MIQRTTSKKAQYMLVRETDELTGNEAIEKWQPCEKEKGEIPENVRGKSEAYRKHVEDNIRNQVR